MPRAVDQSDTNFNDISVKSVCTNFMEKNERGTKAILFA